MESARARASTGRRSLQRLAKKYGDARVEAACAHAMHFGARSYKPIERLLKLGREQLALPGTASETSAITHENVRGPDYYH